MTEQQFYELRIGQEIVKLDEDIFNFIKNNNCSLSINTKSRYKYVKIYLNGKQEYLHRLIMKPTKGQIIDHINGDTLDNCRHNLRICSQSENIMNSKIKGGTSKYKGVSYRPEQKRKKHWRAYIWINDRYVSLGTYLTEKEAAKAYNDAAKKHFGEYAKLNKIESLYIDVEV